MTGDGRPSLVRTDPELGDTYGGVLEAPPSERGSWSCTLCGVAILGTDDIGAAAPARGGGTYLACESCASVGVKSAFATLNREPRDPDAKRNAGADPKSVERGLREAGRSTGW